SLPLIEPDMQISSIRLTDTRRRRADTGSARRTSQRAEAIALQPSVETLARAKRTAASLTPIPQKTAEAYLQIVIDAAEGHARIPSVHRQPEVLFEYPFEPRNDAWSHPPRQHDKIIGVPDQSRVRKLGGAVCRVKCAVEVVQVDVRQQRRNHTTLRRTLPRIGGVPSPLVIVL